MKRLTLTALALCTVLCASGCNLFKRSSKPKENPDIASDVEATFRQRWTDRRTAELVARGSEAGAARRQADAEFRQAYGFTGAAAK